MIKKIFLGISFSLSVNAIHAQKIKIKDEVVIVDGKPILLFSGKAGAFATPNILYSSLNGDSLIRITKKMTELPFIYTRKPQQYKWFEIDFIPFNLHIQCANSIRMPTKKGITSYLLERIKINEGKLDSASVYSFVERLNITEELQAEINYKKGLYEAQQKRLSTKIYRDVLKQIILRLVQTDGEIYQSSYAKGKKSLAEQDEDETYSKNLSRIIIDPQQMPPPEMQYIYEIIQDGKVVGRIVEQCLHRGKRYRVEQLISPALEYEGERFPFVTIAFVETSGTIYTYDKQSYTLQADASKSDLKLSIINYLINHYYL